ncbi:MAG: hypothetical protein K6A82_06840 [Prevotella sp.]|nr:hypothetical protein [Prevotella sp.]
MTKRYTQTQQVIDTMRKHGGYSTLGNLYRLVDTSHWKTKTPQETIRRIVQESKDMFRIQPGLWALKEYHDILMVKFSLNEKESMDNVLFTHSYYQGMVVEIGRMKEYMTYVPAQDQHKLFIDRPLVDVCDTIEIPPFSYPILTNRAKTVDVIWFNDRDMPNSMFEVEHSTDIQNSIVKYCDLQDFHCKFTIIAPQNRHAQYDKVMERTALRDMANRVYFASYEDIVTQYTTMCKLTSVNKI